MVGPVGEKRFQVGQHMNVNSGKNMACHGNRTRVYFGMYVKNMARAFKKTYQAADLNQKIAFTYCWLLSKL